MEATGLVDMPPEVLDMLFENLPIEDKRSVREVCKYFRNIVDTTQIRYKVNLNNRTCGTLAKLEAPKGIKTLVVEDFNKKLASISSTRSILANKEVEELVLAGRSSYRERRYNSSEKPFYYPYLPNETVAERFFEHWFSRESLMLGISEANFRYILGFTNQTVTTLVISSDVIVDLVGMLANSPGLFPNLKSMEITFVNHLYHNETCRANCAMGEFFDLRFPRLQKISFVSPCRCNDVHMKLWVQFYRCIVAHRNTLREVELVHHFHFRLIDFMTANESINREIQQLFEDVKNVQLERFSLAIEDAAGIAFPNKRVFPESFDMQLLRSQTQLKVLKLDIGYYLSAERVFENLPNCTTLEACSIHIVISRVEHELTNLKFLRGAKNLKFLQIVCQQDFCVMSPWRVHGLENLPTSIEVLTMSANLTPAEAAWIHEKLVNLKEIRYLGGIRLGNDESILEPREVDDSNFTHFVECVNRMQNLHTFQLGVVNELITVYTQDADIKTKFKVSTFFRDHSIPYSLQH